MISFLYPGFKKQAAYFEKRYYDEYWYLVPGLGAYGQHTTRLLYHSNALFIQARNPDGSSWPGGTLEPVKKVRVVLVPPSKVTNISWRMGQGGERREVGTTFDWFI